MVRVRGDDALAAEVAAISEQQVPAAGATLEELLRRPHVHYGCALLKSRVRTADRNNLLVVLADTYPRWTGAALRCRL